MFVLAKNGVIVKHPYTITDLKRAYPEISFAVLLADDELAKYDVHRVHDTSVPEVSGSQVVESAAPAFNAQNNRWEQSWSIRDKTVQEIEDELAKARERIVETTQERLDVFAKTRNYDGILSLCTYATSTNAKFQEEGQYGVEARDATWAKLYEILAEVEAGTRPVPSGYANIEPELPALQWPV